jgi:DNA-directed RNA polymerase subunit RPC12/RpoP
MKYLVVLVALIGIIFWNLPATNSSFEGQHNFYNRSAPCSKCHGDVDSILSNDHREIGCKNCHMPDGNTSHSASVKVYCSNCHTPLTNDIHKTSYPQCSDCHQRHGALKDGIGHGNPDFMKIYTCISCHDMRRSFSYGSTSNIDILNFNSSSPIVEETVSFTDETISEPVQTQTSQT